MHQRHGLVNSLLLALVLAVGTAVVWGVVCGFCGDAIRRWQRRQQSSPARTAERLLVTSEGVPVIATMGNWDYQYRTYRTLDGEPVEAATQIAPAAALPDAETLERYGWPVEWSARMTGVNDGQIPPQYWYLIHDGCRPGHAWLEGFDSVSKRRVGYLGRQGFSQTPLPVADHFPLDGRLFKFGRVFGYLGAMEPRNVPGVGAAGFIPLWRGYLVTDGKLVEVDIRQRRVRTVLEDPGLLSAAIVEQAIDNDAQGRPTLRPRGLVAARSADRLWIFDPSANQMRQYALPGDWASGALEVYVLGDEVLLTNAWFGRSSTTFTETLADVHLAWLDRDGRVVRERKVTLQQPYSGGTPGEWEAGAMLPIPTLLGLAAFVAYPLEQVWNGSAASYPEGLVAACRRFLWPIIVVTLTAIALAAWCFRRHRRYAQPGVWMWCLFVLLLGVPGLIGYLLHRRWPVCETCSACGRRVAGDRDTCQACGAAFPAPPPTGIEVFA